MSLTVDMDAESRRAQLIVHNDGEQSTHIWNDLPERVYIAIFAKRERFAPGSPREVVLLPYSRLQHM